MPTPIFPRTMTPLQEMLSERLGQEPVQAPIPQTGLQELLTEFQNLEGVPLPTQYGGGLSAMLKPYRDQNFMSGFDGGGGGGGFGLGSLLGSGGGGASVFSGGGGGGYSGGGGVAIPYSGPPDPTVEQWQAAYPVTGKIPESEMRTVPMTSAPLEQNPNAPLRNVSRDFMMPEAAQSYRAMMRDAAADDVTLAFGQSYRSYPEQVQIAAEKGIYGQGGLAAVPGTSQHGLGLAVDLNLEADPRMRSWLIEHGDEYGWYFPMSDEPWHLQYEGGFEGWQPTWEPDWEPEWSPGAPAPRSTRPDTGAVTSSDVFSSASSAPRRKRRSSGPSDAEIAARRNRAMSY